MPAWQRSTAAAAEKAYQVRAKIAGIAKVHRGELFAALVEGEELEIGGGVVEPGHALGRGAPCSGGNNDLESAKVATAVSVLTAMIEPQDSQSQNAVHYGR